MQPMCPTRRGHAPDPRYAHLIAKGHAEALKRELIRQVTTPDGKPMPAAPLPPAPILNSDEARALEEVQALESVRAQQKANADRAKTEDAAMLARFKVALCKGGTCRG